jgi:hypothetical protein
VEVTTIDYEQGNDGVAVGQGGFASGRRITPKVR